MISVNFYLKEAKATVETPVNLFFSYGKPKPFKYGVGISVNPSEWNSKKQRVRDRSGVKDAFEKNNFLNNIQSLINGIYTKLLSENIPVDTTILKHRLDIALNRKQEKKPMSFMEYLDIIVDYKKSIKASNTHLVKQAVTYIKLYCSKKKVTLEFEDITLQFKDVFNAFLDSLVKKDGSYRFSQNTKVNIFSGLKSILSEAKRAKLNTCFDFLDSEFSVKSEKVKMHSFTEDELLKIHRLDLTKEKKAFNDVRDLFLIGSFTAMRISDYSTMEKENIEDGLIYKKTQKTGANVVVPVHWIVKEILSKRNGEFPPHYNQTKINYYIKLIAKKAGLNDKVMVSKTRGGVMVNEVKYKWEIAQSHTSRRGGIRIMQEYGIPDEDIMQFSGHASKAAFDTYADSKGKNNAEKLRNHAFFKKKDSAPSDAPQI